MSGQVYEHKFKLFFRKSKASNMSEQKKRNILVALKFGISTLKKNRRCRCLKK